MNNQKNYESRKKPSYLKYIIIWLAILGIITFFVIRAIKPSGKSYNWNGNEVRYALTQDSLIDVNPEFNEVYDFDRANVKDISLEIGYIKGKIEITYAPLSNPKVLSLASYTFTVTDAETQSIQEAINIFDTDMGILNPDFRYSYAIKDATSGLSFFDILIYVVPTILTIVVAVILYRSIMRSQGGQNQAFDFGKSKARLEDASKVTFNDVAGCEDEKEEMKEIVDYLKNPKKYSKAGARIPKGVILKGNPGTGKTLLAKAVAGEASVPFYYISGSDFLEMFVGVGASRVRDMFKKARATAPCIVFIDEIDAIGRQRGTGLGGGHDEREQTLNQLLVEMDGFEGSSGVIVLAATNRIDILDPALLRPGRFDRQIEVGLPDLKGRTAILQVHARNKQLSPDVSLESVAKRTPGFSGAELENVLNEAAILSVRSRHEMISPSDIDEAIDRVISGPAKKTKVLSERSKKITAYHEAGHAVIGLKVANAQIVQKITIIPRGNAFGYVLSTPKDESVNQTKSELEAEIVSFLAGRASEEIFFEDVTTGAYDDIKRATAIARAMVTELGMSENIGPIHYEDNENQVFLGRDYGSNKAAGGQVADLIDQEIRKIIANCLEKAKQTILENKDLLILIAEALLKYETITADEIDFLLKYGSLDAYDMYKQNSELMAKGQKVVENVQQVADSNPVESQNEDRKEENENE